MAISDKGINRFMLNLLSDIKVLSTVGFLLLTSTSMNFNLAPPTRKFIK